MEHIKYDKDYGEQLLGKCESFFHSYLLPKILTRSLNGIDNECEIDEEGSAQPLFCICNEPEFGKMIECDNVSTMCHVVSHWLVPLFMCWCS